MINKVKEYVLGGGLIEKEDALLLVSAELEAFSAAADEIRERFCGHSFDLCSIINGKSGRCSEDCKYCAQSVHAKGSSEEYPLLSAEELLEGALSNEKSGALRYSVVTSGRRLSSSELDQLCAAYALIRERSGISLCSSNGLLTYNEFLKLKASGVSRYHNNLETSRRYFPQVCTTHTYDEKIASIQDAQRAGLFVCSGGIMGLGENMEDRIDMALELRRLGVKSIPINFITPIPGTPFEKKVPISQKEARRITALFRFILPDAVIRIAGGRRQMSDLGRKLFMSGANAAITGDMLTTCGTMAEEDIKMLSKLGFKAELI